MTEIQRRGLLASIAARLRIASDAELRAIDGRLTKIDIERGREATRSFAGVDRSATPVSLRHVADPMPVLDAIRQGIERCNRVDRLIASTLIEAAQIGAMTARHAMELMDQMDDGPWDASDLGGEG